MYKSFYFPLTVTILLHAFVLLVALVQMPEQKSVVKRVQPKYVKAELVTLKKPKAVKKTRKITRKKPIKKTVAQKTPAPQQSKVKQQQKAKQLAEQRAKEQRLAKRRAEERLQRQAEQELAEAMAQEEALAEAESDLELANSHIALITETIQNNWSRPPSARNDMEAELILQLVPTGDVVNVQVVKSSGDSAFDRSAENAVRRSERFPELQQLPNRIFERYFRQLRLKFKPEDLRL